MNLILLKICGYLGRCYLNVEFNLGRDLSALEPQCLWPPAPLRASPCTGENSVPFILSPFFCITCDLASVIGPIFSTYLCLLFSSRCIPFLKARVSSLLGALGSTVNGIGP